LASILLVYPGGEPAIVLFLAVEAPDREYGEAVDVEQFCVCGVQAAGCGECQARRLVGGDGVWSVGFEDPRGRSVAGWEEPDAVGAAAEKRLR